MKLAEFIIASIGPHCRRLAVVTAIVGLVGSGSWGVGSEDGGAPEQQITAAQRKFFETKVRPVLIAHCYECHSSKAKEVQGGLLLDTRGGIRRGGDTGPAIVPGDSDGSLLIQAVRHESFEMPPEKRLPDEVIADLVTWIRMGAPDPRDEAVAATATDTQADTSKGFWSFQPPRDWPVPRVAHDTWADSPIDRFLLQRMEASGLEPASDADRYSLVRRVYFDLIGLPPAPQQVVEFVHDNSPDAYEKVVDQLLGSPRFGERWGRHWLDVARFAESSGGGRSLMFVHAWRYRDYVIESLNVDEPYDRLVREQIAGDLMDYADRNQRARQLTATGFLMLGPINYELQDKQLLGMEVVDEQIETMGRAFLGMTIGCARCHDHKFDPIPTKDYYALAGIFGSTKSLVPGNVSGYVVQPLPVSESHEQALAEHAAAVKAIESKLKREKVKLASLENASVRGDAAGTNSPPGDVERKYTGPSGEVTRLQAELKRLKQSAPPPRPLVMSVQDEAETCDGFIYIRGNVHDPGPRVPRGFLSAVMTDGFHVTIPEHASGRRQLADWLASPNNPLTARVMVNRIWYHLFGAGIVRTTDNFGTTGDTPSHPELLDYLATQFIDDGWSIKQTIRRIVLSRAYRLSSRPANNAARRDPDNRLLAHARRRRLDAESIRDSMLAISGQLDLTAGGLTIRKITQYDLGYEFDTVRRSVYVPFFRNSMLDLFEVFDEVNPNVVTGRRTVSTLPTQSLFLMNSPFAVDQARHAAAGLTREPYIGDRERVNRAYLQVIGRLPSASEYGLTLEYLVAVREKDSVESDGEAADAWTGLYHLLFASLDFRYLN